MNRSIRKTLPLFLLLCALACLFLVPSAFADGLEDLQAAIISNLDFSVSGELIIPQGTQIDASNIRITVPVDATLTVNGTLTVGDLHVAADENGAMGYISIPEGGAMTVTTQTDIANFLWDRWLDDGSAGRIGFAEGAALILNRYACSAGMDYDGLARAIYDAGNYFSGSPDASLLFHIHVPKRTTIFALNGDYTEFTISDRVLLTVDGTLLADKFHANGTVTVGEEGFLYAQSAFTIGDQVENGMFTLNGTLSVEHDALDPTQLEVLSIGENGLIDISFNCATAEAVLEVLNTQTDHFPHFRRTIWVLFPWDMGNVYADSDTYTLPDQVRLGVPSEFTGSLTIPAGKTLIIPDSSHIYARGLNEQGDAVIQINGTLTNNNFISLERGNDNSGPAKMALGQNGVYNGTGAIWVRDADDPDECLEGFNGLSAAVHGNTAVFRRTEVLLQGLYEAIGDEDETFYGGLQDKGIVTLPENAHITIPARLHVAAWGTSFILPESSSLTVEGRFETTGMQIDGTLNLGTAESEKQRDDGRFANLGDYLVLNGQINVWQGGDLHIPAVGAELEKILLSGGDNYCTLHYRPESDEDVRGMKALIEQLPEGPYCGSLDIYFPWELSGDIRVEPGTDLYVDGAWNKGSITVPANVTLDVNDRLELKGAPLTVEGVLVNSGRVELTYDSNAEHSDPGSLAFGAGAEYRGRGVIAVPAGLDYQELITGLDLTGFTVREDEWQTVLFSPQAVLDDLRQAIDSGEGYYDLRDIICTELG